jgi:hypothetical protein
MHHQIPNASYEARRQVPLQQAAETARPAERFAHERAPRQEGPVVPDGDVRLESIVDPEEAVYAAHRAGGVLGEILKQQHQDSLARKSQG